MTIKPLNPINTKRATAAGDDAAAGGEAEVAGAEEEEPEPLSPAARVFHVEELNCCIVAMVGCKKKMEVEVVKEGLRQSLIKHPRFSSKLVFDSKKGRRPTGWVRTQVNLDNHIVIPDLDPDMSSPDKFIEDYAYDLTKTRLDLSMPLWELHILNVKTSDANSVGIFKIHHSMGDGISLISLLLACTRKSSDPDAVPTLPIKKKTSTNLNFPRGIFGFLFEIWWVFGLLWNTMVHMLVFLATAAFLKDPKTLIKGEPGIEHRPKRFVYRSVSLEDIKLVKNAMNTTINDVVMGITQAGLWCYLDRRNGDAKGEKGKMAKKMCIRATLLVNIRSTTEIQDLAEKMESDTKEKWGWGNSIGYVLMPFHITPRDDPLDHIRDAKATIDRKKHSLEAVCTYSSAKLILNVLGLRTVAALTYRVLCNTTMSFSNVVGPMEEISFYGHPICFIAPSVYGHPQALTIHFQSLADKMTLVLAVDPDVIPDPRQLCDDIVESLKLANDAIRQSSHVAKL